MHMSDALLSPVVGGVMTAASAAAIGYAAKRVADDPDDRQIPMMSVMGAFVFAAQMVNFTIPGTGASGHIGGGILLAALLGPFPALLTMAVVLLIQCLLFADGGLLAYGCNVWNLGVIPILLAYPLFYRPFTRNGLSQKNIFLASMFSSVIGLQAGAFAVVLETLASGIAELPFGTFLLLMQPIHLAIGFAEGVVTAAVLGFVYRARRALLETGARKPAPGLRILAVFVVLVVLLGGGLSQLASPLPDGLEWSVENTAGTAELERVGPLHDAAGRLVEATSVMPGYGTGNPAAAGVMGSLITVCLVGGVGVMIYWLRKSEG